MRYSWTFNAAGGLGIIGRFAVAMCILLVVKKLGGKDENIDKGIKWLIIAGIGGLVISLLLSVIFMLLFGIGMMAPFHYFY